MITAAQLRAARGLLDWTRAELAKASGLSPETIKNIEHGIFKPTDLTTQAIEKVFALHGVEFIENEGLRRYQSTVFRFEGDKGFRMFMDDVYREAQNSTASNSGSKPICVSNVDEKLFVKHLGDYVEVHTQRMNELENVKVRVLVREKDNYKPPKGNYLEYRWNSNQEVTSVPFYVYGDKFALVMFDEEPSPQVVVISSALASKAYREQFETLWQNSKIPEK